MAPGRRRRPLAGLSIMEREWPGFNRPDGLFRAVVGALEAADGRGPTGDAGRRFHLRPPSPLRHLEAFPQGRHFFDDPAVVPNAPALVGKGQEIEMVAHGNAQVWLGFGGFGVDWTGVHLAG